MDFYTCWALLGDTFERGWGHFLVGSGSLFEIFGMSWDVSGSGLGTFLDWFGKVLENMSGEVEKIKIFKNAREYFSQVGALQNSIFSLSPDQQYKKEIVHVLVVFSYIIIYGVGGSGRAL